MIVWLASGQEYLVLGASPCEPVEIRRDAEMNTIRVFRGLHASTSAWIEREYNRPGSPIYLYRDSHEVSYHEWLGWALLSHAPAGQLFVAINEQVAADIVGCPFAHFRARCMLWLGGGEVVLIPGLGWGVTRARMAERCCPSLLIGGCARLAKY